ncbi:hypothetical protein AHAS_Ahas09G0046300 [Arachis hypogaea]
MTTSQVQKIETEFHIKADAKEFYVFSATRHTMLLRLDGKACVCKDIIEDIDKEDNKISFRVLEGDLLKHHYKSFKFLLHAVPKKKGGCMVRWTMEYEKINENTPDPHTMMQLVVDVSKQVEVHLISKGC